ncbi:MAG TPA: hypothetical protein VF853_09705 [Candidatus Deferrimicrobiaceae bacterium]
MRKTLIVLALGVFVGAMAGVAGATSPVDHLGTIPSDTSLRQPGADPEMDYTLTWQVRGPVDTGSMPALRGNSPDFRCCAGDSGPSVDAAGNTGIRTGIDDGP